VQTRTGERIEIRIFSRRSEYDCAAAIAHESGQSFDRSAGGQRIYEGDARALSVSRYSVIDGKVAKQCFWSNSKCRATGYDFRARSSLPKRVQNASRFRRVVTQRDRIAVVDVPDGNANDVGPELRRGAPCGRNCVGCEAQIEEPDAMPSAIERRRNAREPVRHHRIGLSLAIGAHEQNPRSASFLLLSHTLHILDYTARASLSR
jgi:hypothetical protein